MYVIVINPSNPKLFPTLLGKATFEEEMINIFL